MISIYRNITKVADVEPATSSNYIETLMGEHQMPLAFEVPAYVELLIGDYINYEGVKYTINKLPTIKKISTELYQYNAIFQHPKYDMLKVLYMLFDNTATPAQGEFSLTGTADTFVDLFIANMNRISSGWTKGTVLESEYKTLTFTNENCHSVLERLAQEFDTEFHVMNKTVYLDKIATQRELTLEYGSTAYDIERLSVNSQDVVTRLYVFGSDKNISSQYRNGSARLLIPVPNSYLQSVNAAAYGIVEQAKVFDDIYPRLSLLGAGVVTAVGDKYSFSDSALDFDVNNQLMPGVPAKVRFLTGECAGYDFEIKSYNHATKTYVIIENSKDEDLVLPTDLLKPAVDDKYVLLDVVMPDAYVLAAEEELLAKAQEYLSANDTAKVEYRVTFSALYAKQNLPVIQCSDQVRIYDPDLGVDEYIRIVKLQKGIRDGHNIQIDLSNTVTRSTLQRIDGEIKSINNQVIVSNQLNKQRGIEAYQRSRELQQMVFDPDGYFDTDNIRPLSIETSMLSVGAKSQQYQLTSLLQPNYNANPQSMYWSSGLLTHFSLVDDQVKEWIIASGNITITGDNQTRALYIYARCSRVGSTGDIYVSENAIKFDSDASYWYFLVGILHTPVSGVRGISLSYGQTTINGQFIRTGVISSADGSTYFNLNTGEIGGNIKFKAGSTYTDVGAGIAGAINTAAADATAKANAAKDLAISTAAADATAKTDAAVAEATGYADIIAGGLQAQIDGVVDSWFYSYSPTPSNYPASEWTTTELKQRHVGDTFTNTEAYVDEITTPDAGKSWRWVNNSGVFSWTQIADSDAVLALQRAAQAQDTADGKRRVFTAQPTAPYNVGDLWSQGTAGDLMKCKTERLTGLYNSADWEKASKYTDDTAANEAYNYADEAYMEAMSAQQSAANAQASANTANSLLANIASDSKLTPDEKQSTKKEWDAIVAEYTPILNQGTEFGITTNKTNFTTKYNALSDYITPLLSNLTTTSDITGTEFRTKFAEYYTAKVNLLNSISTVARDLAQQGVDDAYEAANSAQAAANAAATAQAGINALNYLKTALAGSTEISGGLVAANIILLKNALDQITGGLSGIDDDNIGLWTGGTYAQALSDIAKTILRKDGSVQFLGGLFKCTADNKLIIDLNNFKLDNSGRLQIYGDIVMRQTVHSVGSTYSLNEGFQSVGNIFRKTSNGVNSVINVFIGIGDFISEDVEYSIILDNNLTIGGTPITSGTLRLDIAGVEMIGAGIYDGFVSSVVLNQGTYVALKFVKVDSRLLITSYVESNQLLVSGTISSGGIRSNHWGTKMLSTAVTKGGTGIYNIPHQIGHENYTAFVTAKDANMTVYVPNKYADSVQIAIRNASGALADGGFDYVLLGNNK